MVSILAGYVNASVCNVVVNCDIPAEFFSNVGFYDLEIGSSCHIIGDYAFESATLGSVVIQNGVTSIGDYAFSFAELDSIAIPSSVTSIGDGALTHVYNNVYIDSSSIANQLYQDDSYIYNKLDYCHLENIYIKNDCYNSTYNVIYCDNPDWNLQFICNGSADANGYYKYERTEIDPYSE